MEENNKRKGSNLFYAVIGIATLVATIVGSTFAYFSASKTATGDTITGSTNDISASSLTITTARLNLNPSPAPASDNLVPADFGIVPASITTTQVNKALTAKCVNGGYTGCHVWKITASSTETVSNASIKLNLALSNVTDDDDWSYVVYTGTDSAASTIVAKGTIVSAFPNASTTIDIHNGASLSSTSKIYYLMVYLNNTSASQNGGSETGATDARGSYSGTVTLEAQGGQVKASFTS